MNNKGAVAKWQGKGVQNPHRRFDSAPRLQMLVRSCQNSRNGDLGDARWLCQATSESAWDGANTRSVRQGKAGETPVEQLPGSRRLVFGTNNLRLGNCPTFSHIHTP
jgi:hypothetical protein